MNIRKTGCIIICMIVGVFLEGAAWPPDGWRMPVVIVDQTGQQKFPEIYVKGDTIHTIWIDNRSGSYQLYYKRSTDAGYTWSSDVMISQIGEVLPDRKRNISIAGKDNYVYIVYGIKNGTHTLRFAKSTDNGNSWCGYMNIRTGLVNPPDPSICAASDSIRVVYCRSSLIYYCASGNNGSLWNQECINYSGVPDRCPDITTIHNQPYVSFVVNNGGTGEILCANHTTGSWQINIFFTNNPGEFVFSHINPDANGYIYISFEDTLRSQIPSGKIYAFRSPDGVINWVGGPVLPAGREGADFVILPGDSILVTSANITNIYGQ